MTAIASRPQIVEIESQIRTLINGQLMVSVQVSFAAVVSDAKLGEHAVDGRIAKFEPAAFSNNIRLPVAIHTPPAVALEAQNPQSAVVRIVPALCTGATAHVMFALARNPVELAGSAGR